ncbi:hypothetical protein [Pseudonocardia sp. EC080610-09]|nr:hypothetical protein [Pseudonocardia sp. EC080610-09]
MRERTVQERTVQERTVQERTVQERIPAGPVLGGGRLRRLDA